MTARISTEEELKAIRADDVSGLRNVLIEYGIPEELIFTYSDGNFALYNDVNQGLSRMTGKNEWGFTSFPKGHVDRVKEEVNMAGMEGRLESYISSVVGKYKAMIRGNPQPRHDPDKAVPALQPDSVEERIARALEEHYIVITPESERGGKEILYLTKMDSSGDQYIGKIFYDPTTCSTNILPERHTGKTNHDKDLMDEIARPLAKLLEEAKGDFYHERMAPIHDALDRMGYGA